MPRDRAPLPPPYPVGTRLRYVGTRESWMTARDGSRVYTSRPGLVVEIVRVRLGTRGTLRPLGGEWDDTDEPILDETRDGGSVFDIACDGNRHGHLILHEYAHEWEVVP
jgi:hypothetical protein